MNALIRMESLEARRLLANGATSLQIGNTLYFAQADAAHGSELWKSNPDGTNSQLVKDIFPGTRGSEPRWMFNWNGTLYFAAQDASYHIELWRSDGSAIGTTEILAPGLTYGSDPHNMQSANGRLFFFSTSLENLYSTDGTTAGTVLLFKNGASPYQWAPHDVNPIVSGNLLYFQAANSEVHQLERWQSNGTVVGTKMSPAIGLLDDGVLSIFGTNGDDDIRISSGGGTTTVLINGVSQQFANSNLTGILVRGLSGDDKITVDDSVLTRATLMGGIGADSVRGGAGDDVLYAIDSEFSGDYYHDTVDGAGGNDSLVGASYSLLMGGDGNDSFQSGEQSTIQGGDGDDRFSQMDRTTFDGGPGNDLLDCSARNGVQGGGGQIGSSPNALTYTDVERLRLGNGNDQITLAAGDSIRFVDAGAGDDTIIGGAQSETIIGGAGDDSLVGNGGDDFLLAGSGSDTVNGGAGHDTLVAGSESGDSISSDADDTIDSLPARIFDGTLYVVGTSGNDTITLRLKPGNASVVQAIVNAQTLEFSTAAVNGIHVGGGDGNDLITFDTALTLSATVLGDRGNDTLLPGGGNETLDGGDGNDTLDYSRLAGRITSGNRTFNTPIGIDRVYRVETLLSGSGDDSISVYAYSGYTGPYTTYDAIRYLDGGPGNDNLSYVDVSSANVGIAPTVHGGDGDDTLSVDREGGWSSGGYISGGPAYYFGDAGNDTLNLQRMWASRDFNGGPGIDSVNYGGFTTAGGMKITLDDQGGDGPSGFDNVHSDVEIVWGTPWNDTIVGTDRNDSLYGGNGTDSIVGNGGDDLLDAGFSSGFDTLTGGAGHDTLVATSGAPSSDPDDVRVLSGVMQINGSAGDDIILIRFKAGDTDTIQVLVNDRTYECPKALLVNLVTSLPPGVTSGTLPMALPGGFKIDAGDGNDSVTIDPSITYSATIFGGNGRDTLIGGGGEDSINGGADADTLMGGSGNDTLVTDLSDSVDGGVGTNATLATTLPPGASATLTNGILSITGTGGRDAIQLRQSAGDPSRIELVFNGKLSTTSYPLSGVTFIVVDGRSGDDRIEVSSELSLPTKIYGGGGNDIIYGSAGNDRIYGGDGNDWINAGAGNDVIFGDAGNDRIFGGDGNDYLDGGAGTDTLRGDAGIDRIIATIGLDDYSKNRGDQIVNIVAS